VNQLALRHGLMRESTSRLQLRPAGQINSGFFISILILRCSSAALGSEKHLPDEEFPRNGYAWLEHGDQHNNHFLSHRRQEWHLKRERFEKKKPTWLNKLVNVEPTFLMASWLRSNFTSVRSESGKSLSTFSSLIRTNCECAFIEYIYRLCGLPSLAPVLSYETIDTHSNPQFWFK